MDFNVEVIKRREVKVTIDFPSEECRKDALSFFTGIETEEDYAKFVAERVMDQNYGAIRNPEFIEGVGLPWIKGFVGKWHKAIPDPENKGGYVFSLTEENDINESGVFVEFIDDAELGSALADEEFDYEDMLDKY